MKKSFATLAFAALPMLGMAQSSVIHIEGSAPGLTDTVYYATAKTYRTPKAYPVKNGKFSFDGELDEPGIVSVHSKFKSNRERPDVFYTFLGMPGEKAIVSTEGNHYYVTGSKFYQDFDKIDRAMEKIEDGEQAKQFLMDEAKKDPTNEAVVVFLSQFGYNPLQAVVSSLSPTVRNGRLKTYIDEMTVRAQKRQEAEQEAAKKQGTGVVAPDFTLNDINGKPLSLSSLKGKYVLLDFWGSWCGWCIKGIPQMKEYYEKYKGKFEILGIDCNDTEQKWKDAVKKYELPWLHVYNPRNSKVLDDYGIQGFPTKILVGPDGKIVKTIVGESPNFYTFMDELFGKK